MPETTRTGTGLIEPDGAGTQPDPAGTDRSAAGAAAVAAATPSLRERIRDSRLGNFGVIATVAALVVAGTWAVSALRSSDDAAGADDTGRISKVELKDGGAGTAPKVGAMAPDFSAMSITGERVTLSELQGRPVWLVFNATWCANCRAEQADIQTMYKKYGDRVSIVSVYVSEGLSTVTDYAERLGLTFSQLPDGEQTVASEYRVMGIPAHYFIDAKGRIRTIEVGSLGEAQMTERLDAILAD